MRQKSPAEPNVLPLRRGEDPSQLWSPTPDFETEREESEQGGEQVWNIFGVLLRRWMIMAPIAVVVFGLSFGSAAVQPKEYAATALIMINPGREQVITDQELVTNPADILIESEMEVMRSASVMERVVRTLQLEESPEWNPALREPAGWERLVGSVLGSASGAQGAEQQRPAANPEALRRAIAQALPRRIGVRRREPSSVIEVSARSLTPAGAAALANATAREYLNEQTESQFEATTRAQDWLRSRAGELAAEVHAKETAAEAFRVQAGLPAASGGQDAPADVQTMLAQARADLTEKQARLQQVQALISQGGSADLIAGAANSPLIGELRSREEEMQRRQAELEDRYGPRHPDVQSGRVELEALRQRIQGEIGRITTTMRNEVEIARRRLNSLQANFGSETLTLNADNEDMIRYRQLLREAEAAKRVHESFLQRSQEVESQSALPVTAARLMTEASIPRAPSTAGLFSMIQSALLLALAAGLGAGFLVEFLDRTASSAREAERKIGRRAVASMPKLSAHRYRALPPLQRHPAGYVVEKPMSDFSEAFRVLRTSLLLARVDEPVRVVAVTSALENEGKTTVALCLARVAALSGQRVAIIDCDLRRQSLSKVLDIGDRPGLLGVLMDKRAWADVICQDDETELKILTGEANAVTPVDVFSSRAMRDLLEEMGQEFDLIILDCAPVLQVADTRVAAGLADTTLMVVRADKTPTTAVRSAIRELETAGADIHGVALNFVSGAAARMDYSGALHYGKNSYYGY